MILAPGISTKAICRKRWFGREIHMARVSCALSVVVRLCVGLLIPPNVAAAAIAGGSPFNVVVKSDAPSGRGAKSTKGSWT